MITSMAFQRNPDPILWCTLHSGNLISMTYEREQNVIAWAKHPFNRGADVESNGYQTVPGYPTLQIADGTFVVRTTAPSLTHTTAISSILDLQHIADDLSGNYYLTADIDASETANWNNGAGFDPIDNFKGTLDGGGFTISNLFINRPTEDKIGLFGSLDSTTLTDVIVKDLTLENVNFTGENYAAGGLFGEVSNKKLHVYNCHTSGTIAVVGIAGVSFGVGGMVGVVSVASGTEIIFYDCTADVDIDTTGTADAMSEVGGFVGTITGGSGHGFYNCRASGNLTGKESGNDSIYGGFVGDCGAGTVFQDCSATGDIAAELYVGGFCGIATIASFTRCSARGNVVGSDAAMGGFVANTYGTDCTWTDCYAWGSVTDSTKDNNAGGFIGDTNADTTFTNCYAIGALSGTDNPAIAGALGGFIGLDGGDSTFRGTFWNEETTGQTTSDGGIGHDTEWMMTQYNYEIADWDFSTVWDMPDPVLWTEYGPGANSVAVIPGSAEDEVWLIVSRVIGGSIVRYLEQMQPRKFGLQEDAWFVDSGLKYDGEATATLSGLDHLEGEEVCILGDGAVFAPQTVINGSITLDTPVSKAIVGLPYRYKLKPMRFDISTGTSTTQTATKRITEVAVSFYETLNAKYGVDEDHLFNIDWRTTEPYGSPPALFTGDKIVCPEGGFDSEDTFIITGNDPLPCTVRAMVPRIGGIGR